MTDDADRDPLRHPAEFRGAASPEPSLAARMDRSTAADAVDAAAGGSAADPVTTPVPDRQETGREAPLVEGPETAPRTGRVDAAGADYGPDADRDRVGRAASGGPTGSIGGALERPPGEDLPGDEQ
ncbi:MAG TPA: hypothetical protein VFS32_02255 [Candidatus Limnocylindrales bacterium]|nr:hypothetical protein [Candidatus Limnocylindrales bacterium]